MEQFEHSEALKRLPKQFFAHLVHKVKTLQAEGHDVINLGQGNPDLPTPDSIVKELQAAAELPHNHKYSPFSGKERLKEATAEFYQREYGVDLDPETEVSILFGAKTGLVEITPSLTNPGDTILLPDPGYPDYLSGAALGNVNVETMPLLEKNGFLPDYTKIPAHVLAEAKLMFLNYPNNPTAATADRTFFDKTVELAKKHHICVVHDFAYGAIGYDGKKQQSFLQSKGSKENGVEIYTLSKTYNMAGWRVGMAVGNRSVIEAINFIQDHMYVSLFGAIQDASIHALTADQAPVRELVSTYESRRDVFVEKMREIGWRLEAPKGTFFVWMPVPEGYTSETFSEVLLEKAHVATAPGNGFGSYGEGYVRVGLLDSEERLLEACDRIAKLHLL